MRSPGSGGGTPRELPDVLAGNGCIQLAIEAKSRSSGWIYLSGDEVESLIYFAQTFGAKARVGVRYDYNDWRFFHPGDLHMTPAHGRLSRKYLVFDSLDPLARRDDRADIVDES